MRLLRVRATTEREEERRAVATQIAKVARLQRELHRARVSYEAALADLQGRSGRLDRDVDLNVLEDEPAPGAHVSALDDVPGISQAKLSRLKRQLRN